MFTDKKFKILIVDDERSNITALFEILKIEYHIFAAKDGRSAIEAAHKNKPDLILLDVLMPDISGFEVLSILKESDNTRDIPVIFITGLDNIHDEERGLILGAVDYIKKPFNNSIVKLRVSMHLKIIEQMRTIERLGMIDALTQIPNRRSFDHQLNVEWNRAMREKIQLSILMIDIDKFKSFNDIYGHAHGDKVLKAVAEVITDSLRHSSDFAARWGGEEFAVLLPGDDKNEAFDIAEKIRRNTEDEIIPCHDGSDTKVTVSIGVNTVIPRDDLSIEDFCLKADKALYCAKQNGRNNVK